MNKVLKTLIVLLSCIITVQSCAYADDAVGIWSMDDQTFSTGGTIKEEVHDGDNSFWGETTVMTTDAFSVEGKSNYAADVSGGTAFLPQKFPEQMKGNKSISISAWLKTPETCTSQMWAFQMGSSNDTSRKIYMGLRFWNYQGATYLTGVSEVLRRDNGNAADISRNASCDTWYHVALVYEFGDESGSGYSGALYLNGELVNRINYATCNSPNVGIPNDTNYISFGSGVYRTGVVNEKFKGIMDDIRIYDRTLSDSDVKDLYDCYKNNLRVSEASIESEAENVSIDTDTIDVKFDKEIADSTKLSDKISLNGDKSAVISAEQTSQNEMTIKIKNNFLEYYTDYTLEAPCVYDVNGGYWQMLNFKTEKPVIFTEYTSVDISDGTGIKNVDATVCNKGDEVKGTIILANTKNGRILNNEIAFSKSDIRNGENIKTVSLAKNTDGGSIQVFHWNLERFNPYTKVVSSNDDPVKNPSVIKRYQQASVSADISINNTTFSANGSISSGAEREISLMILNPEASKRYSEDETFTLNPEDVYMIAQATSDQNGEFVINSIFDENSSSGFYTVIIGGDGVVTPISKSIYYASETTINKFIESINNCTTDQELKSIFDDDDNLDILFSVGVDKSRYNKSASNSESYSRIIDKTCSLLPYDSAQSLVSAVNEFVDYELLVNTDKKELNTEFLSFIDKYSVNIDKKEFENLSEDAKAEFFDSLKKNAKTALATKNGLEQFSTEMIMVSYLNNCDWRDISDYVTDRRSKIEDIADMNIRNSLSENLCKSFKNTAEKSKFESAEEIVKYINGYNEETEKPSKASAGGGGGKAVKTEVSNDIIKESNKSESALPSNDKTFVDSDEFGWAKESIEVLYKKGIINGDENGKFNPNRFITRAEFIKMVVEAFNIELGGNSFDFDDVTSDSWYADYVHVASSNNIVLGFDGYFYPNSSITREDVALIISRVMSLKNISPKIISDGDFYDIDTASDYVKNAITYLKQCGIIKGYEDNSFMPKKECTRGEMASLFAKLLSDI